LASTDTQQPSIWQPPSGFQAVKSGMPGITVYAPVPQRETVPESKNFNCPQCGASIHYDVAAGGVACEYCGYEAPLHAGTVGRAAPEAEFTLDTWQKAEQGWGVERKALYCENCGASLTLADGALTATCPYCASNRVTLRLAAQDAIRPRFLVPFKLPLDKVPSRALEWMGKGWFHPAELANSALIQRFTGIYLPFWTFDAEISADWRAEVGYERQESYYDAGDKTWKTRTVIDWRWKNGRVRLTVDDLLIVGSSKLSHIILERLYPFNLNELVRYTPDYLAGWQAQAYDVTLPIAWEQGKEEMRERARNVCYDDIPTQHVRNFSMAADFANETWRYLLLPVYVAAYQFEGKVFQVMVNGQTGLVAGQKPVAWWKIWLAITAMLTPGFLLGLIGLPALALGGVGVILLVLGFVLVLLGGAGAIALYRQAIASEAA
jgi:DNA-directed RNA polymerase subunit RPC12/RpoP